jgi:hypothetical protein
MVSFLVLLRLCDAYIHDLILLLACGGAVDGTNQGCLLIQESTFLLLEALKGVLSRDYLLRP